MRLFPPLALRALTGFLELHFFVELLILLNGIKLTLLYLLLLERLYHLLISANVKFAVFVFGAEKGRELVLAFGLLGSFHVGGSLTKSSARLESAWTGFKVFEWCLLGGFLFFLLFELLTGLSFVFDYEQCLFISGFVFFLESILCDFLRLGVKQAEELLLLFLNPDLAVLLISDDNAYVFVWIDLILMTLLLKRKHVFLLIWLIVNHPCLVLVVYYQLNLHPTQNWKFHSFLEESLLSFAKGDLFLN